MSAIVFTAGPSETDRPCKPDVARPAWHRGTVLATVALLCAALAMRHSGMLTALPLAAVFLAATVSSIAGFAFSAIAGAMLFHVMSDPLQVVQIMMACSIVNQFVMTWSLRHEIRWARLSVFLAGGLCGLPLGLWLLLHADKHAYTQWLGAFLALYGAWMLLRRPFVLKWRHGLADFAVGMMGGVTGGAAGFPGAAVTIWCGCLGLDKASQRALTQPYILCMQIFALVAISAIGMHSGASLLTLAWSGLSFVPASVLGTTIGLGLFRRLSDAQFTRVVNLLLIVSGISYLA